MHSGISMAWYAWWRLLLDGGVREKGRSHSWEGEVIWRGGCDGHGDGLRRKGGGGKKARMIITLNGNGEYHLHTREEACVLFLCFFFFPSLIG